MNKRFNTIFYSLYHLLVHMFGVVRIFPTVLTSKRQLTSLINKLHPINPGVEMIRLGPKGDGGYLVPNDLIGIEACFSPGVLNNSGFEEECARLGMKVFMADGSVDGPSITNDRFNFTKKYIGATTSDSFMTIDDWVNYTLPLTHTDLLLQIDIEGYEYESFLSLSNNLMQRFRIIVVEFHRLDQLWSRPFFRMVSPTFEKILQTHSCVHIHPNNASRLLIKHGLTIPGAMEFTFLRKDRVIDPSFASVFPHKLDSNNIKISSRPLPKCWYRN